ncbi:hypothetical protein EA462_06345 [Natrarchaeobius halalkaliphilus]|uniref:Uncharacterized protein n=1 Tax=Natrarchaeobius halalkaliphilus TaxID=1679091 RepID=A0A3N6M691_9EURY|nr:hypothetical protein EA462_06345 [Natrarchaeobius halalkaliphilus]
MRARSNSEDRTVGATRTDRNERDGNLVVPVTVVGAVGDIVVFPAETACKTSNAPDSEKFYCTTSIASCLPGIVHSSGFTVAISSKVKYPVREHRRDSVDRYCS